MVLVVMFFRFYSFQLLSGFEARFRSLRLPYVLFWIGDQPEILRSKIWKLS